MQENPKTKLPHSANKQPLSEELIRRRAFEIYEAHGREDGHELEDWLQAEAEAKEVSARAA